MKVIKINPDTGGIIYENGKLIMLEGKEAILQNLKSFFSIAKGEYFLNTKYGIDYFDTGYTTDDRLGFFDAQVKTWLSSKSWIKSVTGYKSSVKDGIITITIDTINTEDGIFQVGEIVI
jgi:hypothetical protein